MKWRHLSMATFRKANQWKRDWTRNVATRRTWRVTTFAPFRKSTPALRAVSRAGASVVGPRHYSLETTARSHYAARAMSVSEQNESVPTTSKWVLFGAGWFTIDRPVSIRKIGRAPPPSSFQARAQRPMTVCDGLPELNLWKRPLMKTAFVFGSTCNCSRNFLSWWRTRRGAMVRSRVSALRHLFHCESLARRCDSISQRETLNATLKSHPQHTLVGVYSFWCYPLGKWKKFPSNLLTASYPRYKRYGRNMKKSER